jgi:hypothetical protein
MKLNEQNPFDNLNIDPNTGESTTIKPVKVDDTKNKSDKKQDKLKPVKVDDTKNKTDTKQDNKFTRSEKVEGKKKLIRNAIIFYEAICKQLPSAAGRRVNIGERRRNEIFRLLGKYVTIQYAPYIDMLIRIIYEPKLISSRQKNQKAYDYWLSRNGETGTNFTYLESIDNDVMHRLDYIFNGSVGKQLGSDDPTNKTAVKFKKQFMSIYPNILKAYWPQDNHIMRMNGRKSIEEIEKLVLDTYKNQSFGTPKI